MTTEGEKFGVWSFGLVWYLFCFLAKGRKMFAHYVHTTRTVEGEEVLHHRAGAIVGRGAPKLPHRVRAGGGMALGWVPLGGRASTLVVCSSLVAFWLLLWSKRACLQSRS